MSNGNLKFIWRCVNCSNHFANVEKMNSQLKLEKKCSKCKSINILTLSGKEIFIKCKIFEPEINSLEKSMEERFDY